jgi:hypothetical protein
MNIRDLLFHYRPSIGASTPEPSLFDIIYKYYREHFTERESLNFTEDYINNLMKLSGDKS